MAWKLPHVEKHKPFRKERIAFTLLGQNTLGSSVNEIFKSFLN